MGKQDLKRLEIKERKRLGIEKEKGKWGKEKKKKREEKRPRAKIIIRIAETDLDGNRPVKTGILSVRGVSFMFANAVANATGLGNKKIADLTEEEKKRLEDAIYHPEKYNIPVWLFNRRYEPATGANKHLIGSQLQLTQKMDIGEMRKLKTYKGIRHSLGLPVRGQRTRSSFRSKGVTVGVKKQKQQPGKASK